MEFRQIQYFLAVAEHLHFRHAAELVHVAQPALSQQIHKLEQEIGQKLFDRTYHKVSLTPAGKAFYEKTHSMLDDANLAIDHARRAGRGEVGKISIGYVSSAAIHALPEVVTRFRHLVPDAEIELCELSAEEQFNCLNRGKLDIGFFHAQLSSHIYGKSLIAKERLIVALPQSSTYASRHSVDLKDLASEPVFVPPKHSAQGYYDHVIMAYQLAGAEPACEFQVKQLQSALFLVAGGLGIALLPESFRSIQVKGLVYRELAKAPPEVKLIATWRRENQSPLLARFVAELRECRRKMNRAADVIIAQPQVEAKPNAIVASLPSDPFLPRTDLCLEYNHRPVFNAPAVP